MCFISTKKAPLFDRTHQVFRTMKSFVVFISLLVAVSCQNPGFFFNGPALLGLNNNPLNNRLNSGLNGGSNGLSNGFNGLNNNGFGNGLNGLNNKGFLLNNNNAGLGNSGASNGGLMGMILGGNSYAGNNLQSLASNQQQNGYPTLPQVPALPVFTDNLNYQQGSQAPLPVPQATALNTPGAADYSTAQDIPLRKSGFPLFAPGRLSTLGLPGLAPVPELPVIANAPVDLSQSRSLTANLRNDQSLSGPNLNAPLFPNGVPGGSNNANNNNANSNNLLNNNGFLNNNNLLSNGLLNNNNGAFLNNGLQNGNAFLNNNGQGADKLPLEVSEYSTKIVHNTAARAALAKGNGLN